MLDEGTFRPLADGDPIPLVTPPQGGHVVFIAARLRNMDPCNVTLHAVLRNADDGSHSGEESRSIDFDARTDADGWAYADLSDYANAANVPPCPDYFGLDVVDARSTLVVTATDRAARSATATRTVYPRCQERDDAERAACRCECSANYTLGRCRDPLGDGWLDGGPREAGDDG